MSANESQRRNACQTTLNYSGNNSRPYLAASLATSTVVSHVVIEDVQLSTEITEASGVCRLV